MAEIGFYLLKGCIVSVLPFRLGYQGASAWNIQHPLRKGHFCHLGIRLPSDQKDEGFFYDLYEPKFVPH